MIAEMHETADTPAGRARTGLRHAADWLCLAATPIFAVMAVVTTVQEQGAAAALCSAAPMGSLMSGMALMYALMSVFHMPAWLRLKSR